MENRMLKEIEGSVLKDATVYYMNKKRITTQAGTWEVLWV